jgi:hypothetical protein
MLETATSRFDVSFKVYSASWSFQLQQAEIVTFSPQKAIVFRINKAFSVSQDQMVAGMKRGFKVGLMRPRRIPLLSAVSQPVLCVRVFVL